MDISARVDAAELLANIDKLPQALKTALASSMELACELVEANAVDRCPQKSGHLKNSILHEVETSDSAVHGFVGSNVDYAPFVHEGTGIYATGGNGRKDVPWTYRDEQGNYHRISGQRPRPFVQDAIDANRAQILECFEGVLGT